MPSTPFDYDEASYDQDTFSESNNHFYFPKRKRLYYPTKLRCRVVNAKTGHVYPFCQGSFEELQLYKVIDSTAKCDANGFLLSRSDPVNKDPNFLYYDNPEQFIRHQRIESSQEKWQAQKAKWQAQKAKWYANNRRMFPPNGGFIKSEWELIKAE